MLFRSLSVVERYAPLGSPLWPSIPSSLYGAFLRNETRGMHLFVATYDAAQPGYGAVVRCDDDRDGANGLVRCDDDRDGANGLLVGTFPRGSPVGEQVHCEALACPLILEAMSRRYHVRGSVIIFRNDASSALTALRKGSSSPVLQECASRLALLCADLDVDPLFLHAPGRTMVDEGIDDASRSLAQRIRGPACNESFRSIIFAAAGRRGWSISVDAFVSSANRLVARYYSEYAEADSEAVDEIGRAHV